MQPALEVDMAGHPVGPPPCQRGDKRNQKRRLLVRDPDYEQVTVDHERVLLGALRLAVTAQAAVAALQVGRVGDAASRLDRWSRVAVGLFGQSGELEEHKLEDEPVENSAELVRRVYRRLGNGADGALFWTLEWLESTSAEKVVNAARGK